MSYVYHGDPFGSTDGVQELTLSEVNDVSGGPGPILAFLGTPPGLAVIAATGAAMTAGIAWVASASSDDCTTHTRTWTDSRGVRHTLVQEVCD